jgi:hypothetical protein
MVYMGLERGGTEETFLEEGDKKRRRTGEKKYKVKVNKKIDGQRKQKPEKKHNKKRKNYRWIITGVKLGIKEMRQEEGCMERKVHIDNK